MTSTDKTLQEEEWECFESVFPDLITDPLAQDGSLKLEIPVSLGSSHTLDITQNGSTHRETMSVCTLPPLLLHVLLPPCYPTSQPPSILLLRASGSWLTHLNQLREILLSQWTPGDLVLDRWTTAILSGDVLVSMDLLDRSTKVIQLVHPEPISLVPKLQEYDAAENTRLFAESSFYCSLCLNHVRGTECLSLSCKHIFGRDCLKDFWGLCIAEGESHRVGCPDSACVKAQQLATDEDVARVMAPDQIKRLKWLREKASFEKDPTILYCPMSLCQTPVPKPLDSEDGSGWERFRSCKACSFSFCAYCRRTWHGPISACPVSASESLVMDYLRLPSGSKEQHLVEQRYGLTNLKRLVANFLEERANAEIISNTTTKCPQCDTAIEKSLGCNHMKCTRCSSHFCFRCGSRLNPQKPYEHFNLHGGLCYGKLFDVQTEEDLEWQPVAGFDFI